MEIRVLFVKQRFAVEFYGNTSVDTLSLKKKVFCPIKKWAVKLGLIPRTLKGKIFIKKLILGRLVKMPPKTNENIVPFIEPNKLSFSQPDNKHKVIYCVATLQS